MLEDAVQMPPMQVPFAADAGPFFRSEGDVPCVAPDAVPLAPKDSIQRSVSAYESIVERSASSGCRKVGGVSFGGC